MPEKDRKEEEETCENLLRKPNTKNVVYFFPWNLFSDTFESESPQETATLDLDSIL